MLSVIAEMNNLTKVKWGTGDRNDIIVIVGYLFLSVVRSVVR